MNTAEADNVEVDTAEVDTVEVDTAEADTAEEDAVVADAVAVLEQGVVQSSAGCDARGYAVGIERQASIGVVAAGLAACSSEPFRNLRERLTLQLLALDEFLL